MSIASYCKVGKNSIESGVFILGDFSPSHAIDQPSNDQIPVPQVYTTALSEGNDIINDLENIDIYSAGHMRLNLVEEAEPSTTNSVV